MNTKMCKKCNQIKLIVDFNKKGNGLQSNCKECTRAQVREHYKNNTKYYVDKSKNLKQDLKSFLKELKDVPCKDCGIKYPSYVMDFDHLGDKEFLISKMTGCGSKKKIMIEAAKCDVVCSNCHRIRTHNRL